VEDQNPDYDYRDGSNVDRNWRSCILLSFLNLLQDKSFHMLAITIGLFNGLYPENKVKDMEYPNTSQNDPSHEKLHRWFTGTKLYKNNLESYVKGQGMTWKTKIRIMITGGNTAPTAPRAKPIQPKITYKSFFIFTLIPPVVFSLFSIRSHGKPPSQDGKTAFWARKNA